MATLARIVLIFVAVLFLFGERAGAEPSHFERRVIAPRTKLGRNCYPCMARLSDGRLMVVWSAAGVDKKHHILGAMSEDHGRTWSQPRTLIQTPGGRDYDPSILVSGSRVFVSSTTLPPGGGIRTSTTWCTRSDDHGRSWSDLYKIPMNHRYTCGKTHRGLRLKSGTLLLGYSWDALCEQGRTLQGEGQMHLRAGVMISTDDGKTWRNGGDTDAEYQKISGGAVHGTDEPAIVELDDGSVYMLVRTGSTHLYQARSTDEGKTWTDIGPSPLRGSNAPAALCKFEVEGRRGIMCVWDNAVTRYPLCAAASFDGGKTWSKPKDIAGPTGGRQASYPNCVQAADGTLVAVWQQGVADGRDVRCARFNLAWLLDDPAKRLQKQRREAKLPRQPGPARGYRGGDPAKATPAWKGPGKGGTVAADGTLRLLPNSCCHIDNQPSVWDGTLDKLVEFRMRVIERDKSESSHSAAEMWIGGPQPATGCGLFFREDAVAFDGSYDPCYRLDTTKFHTYRLLTDLAAGKAYLFVDDGKEAVLAAYLGTPYGLAINRVLFGDSSGAKHDVFGTSEWKFVRWRDVLKELPPAQTGGIDWVGSGQARILLRVSPRKLQGRRSDQMPARVHLDLRQILSQLGVDGKPDLERLQVIRYDPQTGMSAPCQGFRGLGPHDIPYRFDDFGRRAYTFWYNVEGNGHVGELVWVHQQEGSSPACYAVYVDTLKPGAEPGQSPVPLLGDCDALWTDQSDGYLITALHCKPTMCDFNGDGLLDLLVGEIQGHIFFFENRGTRQKPRFARGRFLMLDGKPLRFRHYTTPYAVDWDDDGDFDLIVGRSMDGQVLYLENVGSRTQPELALRGRVEADGQPITIPHELKPGETFLKREYMCKPEVVDFDGDGDKDLLAGGYVSGAIFYFENLCQGKGVPKLTARGPIAADGKTLRLGSAASPCVADFDGDGDLDMITARGNIVVGKEDPTGITYFENVGTRTRPELKQREFPFAQRHHVGGVAVPCAGDWDSDGDVDLAIGTASYVRLYRNVGSSKKPVFRQDEALKNRWGPVATGGFATAPADWDGDGDLDLVASSGGQFALKLNVDSRNPPRWTNAGMLKADGKEIKYVFPVGDAETFPVIADLNRDGLPDLLQGVASGYVWYYKNVGSRTEPKLAKGVRLRLADGEFVKVGYYKPGDEATDFATHSGDRSDPKPADFDGDGDLDLMVSDAYGFVTYFENVGGNAEPVFAEGVKVIHQSNARALIGVTDWDHDGRVDVLLAQGNIRLFRNVGKGKEQRFQADRAIPHQYIPYPHPYVVDWNKDGDDDLLISSSYGVAYLLERSYVEGGYAEATLIGVQRAGSTAAPSNGRNASEGG